jgi:hypothetical protein
LGELKAAAGVLGVQLLFQNACDPGEFDRAFAALVRESAGVPLVGSDASCSSANKGVL